MNASGCGVQVKEYGYLLARDPRYAAKARRISEMTKDVAEFLPPFAAELHKKLRPALNDKVVFHPPCTLQHGQQIHGAVENLLASLGAVVAPFAESHMCCGSDRATRVQPELASATRPKARSSQRRARCILSANIGCITHRPGYTNARDALDRMDRDRLQKVMSLRQHLTPIFGRALPEAGSPSGHTLGPPASASRRCARE